MTTTDHPPVPATQTTLVMAQTARTPLYIELPSALAEPPARPDRVHERQLEEPERWDGMA